MLKPAPSGRGEGRAAHGYQLATTHPSNSAKSQDRSNVGRELHRRAKKQDELLDLGWDSLLRDVAAGRQLVVVGQQAGALHPSEDLVEHQLVNVADTPTAPRPQPDAWCTGDPG
jgi:hypothetical protein